MSPQRTKTHPRAVTDSRSLRRLGVKAGCWRRRTLGSWDEASPTSHVAAEGRPTGRMCNSPIRNPATSTSDLVCVPDATAYGH